VYRRGADVWIYRREGAASLEGTATQVARLLDEIRAVPPAGDKPDVTTAAPAPASGALSRSFLIGLLTGVLLAVLLVIVFNWLFAGSLQSMLGFTGATLGILSIRGAPVPKDSTARQVAWWFCVGLAIYSLSAFATEMLVQYDFSLFSTAEIISSLGTLLGLFCIMIGVMKLYPALGTTVMDELGGFATIFTGTITVTVAVTIFLRGTARVIANELHTLVLTVLLLIVSTIIMALVGPLVLGKQAKRLPGSMDTALSVMLCVTIVQFVVDFASSVALSLWGKESLEQMYRAQLADINAVSILNLLSTLVAYGWGLSVLLIEVGRPLVAEKPASPRVDTEITIEDLVLRWK